MKLEKGPLRVWRRNEDVCATSQTWYWSPLRRVRGEPLVAATDDTLQSYGWVQTGERLWIGPRWRVWSAR